MRRFQKTSEKQSALFSDLGIIESSISAEESTITELDAKIKKAEKELQKKTDYLTDIKIDLKEKEELRRENLSKAKTNLDYAIGRWQLADGYHKIDGKTIRFSYGDCDRQLSHCCDLYRSYTWTGSIHWNQRKEMMREAKGIIDTAEVLIDKEDSAMKSISEQYRTIISNAEAEVTKHRSKVNKLVEQRKDHEMKIIELGSKINEISNKIERIGESNKGDVMIEILDDKSGSKGTIYGLDTFPLVILGDHNMRWTIRSILYYIGYWESPIQIDVFCDDGTKEYVEEVLEESHLDHIPHAFRKEPRPGILPLNMDIQGLELLGVMNERLPLFIVRGPEVTEYLIAIKELISSGNHFIILTDNDGLDSIRKYIQKDIVAIRKWDGLEGYLNTNRGPSNPIKFLIPEVLDPIDSRYSATGKKWDGSTLILCDTSNSINRSKDRLNILLSTINEYSDGSRTHPDKTLVLSFRTESVSDDSSHLALYKLREFIDGLSSGSIPIWGNSPLCDAILASEHILNMMDGDIERIVLITSNLGIDRSGFKKVIMTAYQGSRMFREVKRELRFIGDNEETERELSLFTIE